MVMQLPEGDRYSYKYKWMTSRLTIMMGGRIAEELQFGKENITSGAQSDIEQATKLAKAMVTRWGFSDELGTVAYGENQEEVFLGYSMGQRQTISESTAQKIDQEVRKLIDTAYVEARRILTEKRADFETLAQGLLEYETLSGDEIVALLHGDKPKRDDDADANSPPRGTAVPTAGKGRPRPDAGMEPQPLA
jgi:cell division protease FtsH